MEPVPPSTPKPEPVGPMVGIVIIVLVLLAGGIYFLLIQSTERTEAPAGEEQASL